jgi:hypothetical protein
MTNPTDLRVAGQTPRNLLGINPSSREIYTMATLPTQRIESGRLNPAPAQERTVTAPKRLARIADSGLENGYRLVQSVILQSPAAMMRLRQGRCRTILADAEGGAGAIPRRQRHEPVQLPMGSPSSLDRYAAIHEMHKRKLT